MRKKIYFGDDHEIQFESVVNHDAYAFLRITLEIPRGQENEATILLNNKPVGTVTAIREVRGDRVVTVGYEGKRQSGSMTRARELGRVVAAVVSDHVS